MTSFSDLISDQVLTSKAISRDVRVENGSNAAFYSASAVYTAISVAAILVSDISIADISGAAISGVAVSGIDSTEFSSFADVITAV